MMEVIAEGFARLKVLVSELLTVEKSQRKIEENGMFVKGLLQQLSASTLDESLDIPNTRTDVTVEGNRGHQSCINFFYFPGQYT